MSAGKASSTGMSETLVVFAVVLVLALASAWLYGFYLQTLRS